MRRSVVHFVFWLTSKYFLLGLIYSAPPTDWYSFHSLFFNLVQCCCASLKQPIQDSHWAKMVVAEEAGCPGALNTQWRSAGRWSGLGSLGDIVTKVLRQLSQEWQMHKLCPDWFLSMKFASCLPCLEALSWTMENREEKYYKEGSICGQGET